MKKLIIKSLLFLSPIIFPGIVIEYLLRLTPNDYKVKSAYYAEHAKDIEVLCLGESHAFSGINPIYLDLKGFNGSHVLQSLNYDLIILKKYQKDLVNLKYLLIPISYASFTENLENGREKWRVKNYFLYYDIKKIQNPYYYTEIFSLPFQTNIFRLTDYYIYKKSPITTDSLGHGLEFMIINQKSLEKTGEIAAKLHTATDYDNWKTNYESLREIISICNRKNVRVILFTAPANIHYVNNLQQKQLARTTTAAWSLASSNKNVFYINLLTDPGFSDNDFYDANHFSESGSRKLTTIINAIIREFEKDRNSQRQPALP
jgi:hypothetical protein